MLLDKYLDWRRPLQQISSYSPNYVALFNRLNSVLIELDDIIGEIEKEESTIDFDAERAEFVKERINMLYRLLTKHRVKEIKELLQLQEELQQKATITGNVDEALENRRKTYDKAVVELQSSAKKVSDSRKKVFSALGKSITALLKELGIPSAAFEFEHTTTEPSNSGIDRIEILFSANKGIPPKPLAQVASGGEFARLMFCIKHVMAERQAMPTLVLDEIDTGVSGEIALKLGSLMTDMAKRHQLIAISHLPQIAAKGDAHFFVYKDNSAAKTISVIKELTKEERIEKIAEMIGGSKPSKVAVESAKELLKIRR
jgi:DNA repair protein RecN (Recombination protein N)